MRKIGGDTRGVDDIVERELVNEWASLHEKGERLANAAGGTCDDYKNRTVSDSVVIEAI